jgi:glutaredoxin 3
MLAIMTTHVEIWTRHVPYCGYCHRAKALLQQLNIPYQEHILGTPENSELEPHQQLGDREQLLQRVPDARTVPQIWLDGEYVGGYDDLAKHPKITG